mgnify:CR=1 FL=1
MAFDWKGIIKQAAPLLGTALGGPFGAAAGAIVAKALGGDETKTTPDDLAKLVTNVTPEQLLALKNAEQEWAFKLKELELDSVEKLEALAAQDRDSARKREIAVRDKTPMLLAIVYTTGFFGILLRMLIKGVPKEAGGEALLILLGALAAGSTQVLNYYFGSSSGSDRKTELLHQSAPAK